jgi:hypothetical protein
MQERNIKSGTNLKFKDTLIMNSMLFQEANSSLQLQIKLQDPLVNLLLIIHSQMVKLFVTFSSQQQTVSLLMGALTFIS